MECKIVNVNIEPTLIKAEIIANVLKKYFNDFHHQLAEEYLCL